MNLDEAMAGRRSVRQYTAQAVDEQTIRLLIDDAMEAPSAVNGQFWTFTVVRNGSVLDRVSRDAKAHMLATTPADALPAHFKSMLDDPDCQVFHHAPVLVLISAAAEGAWNVEDCALAAQNLMLAAYAVGLGSCWIGLAQGYLRTTAGKAALNLPVKWTPVTPIILGHPKAAAAPVPRKSPEILWVD